MKYLKVLRCLLVVIYRAVDYGIALLIFKIKIGGKLNENSNLNNPVLSGLQRGNKNY